MTTEFELSLFQKFLKKYSPEGDWEFQVSLPIFRKPTELTTWQWKQLKDVIALRVDAIMTDKTGKYHIFEFKRVLRTGALGQLKIYAYLFAKQKGISESEITINVIYEEAQKGIEEAYEHFNVNLWRV